jgi:hypothetical protein
VQFYLDSIALDAAGRGDEHRKEQLVAVCEVLQREPPTEEGPAPAATLPPGCAQCVVVEPQGGARLTRVHVRFGNWGRLDQEPLVGQAVPGARAALDAARQYLAMSGCAPIDDLPAEVLVEGLFRPVHGESLALAVFMAAVSARLKMPVPADWAFTGAIGTPSADSPAGAVMPVNEIQAKLTACGLAGCSRLMVPAHLLPDSAGPITAGPCRLEPATTTVEAIQRVLPAHRMAEAPRVVGWREYGACFLRALVPGPRSAVQPTPAPAHRVYRLAVPCFFAAMLTERWLVADYLIPEYYLGVYRPPVWLAVALGCLAAAVIAATFYASLRVVDVLLDREVTVNWWIAAAMLLAGCTLAWLPAQALIREPSAPPPHGIYFEHRTLQGWKDTTNLFLYGLIFFVSPYTRVRLAERAAAARRLRWAEEILAGRRWANATFPVTTVPLLVVIASVALMGMGYLDWQSLVDPSRAGAGPLNGPWRTIHILGRAELYLLSCIAVLWWLGRSMHRVVPPDARKSR